MLRARDYIGIANLRHMNASQLRALDRPLVIVSHSRPVAALVPYTLYLQWQELAALPVAARET